MTSGAEEALPSLEAAGAQAEALVAAWVAAKNVVAVAAAADRATGGLRKAARRALKVLASRGVRPPPRTHVARLGAPVDETTEAWLLSPDTTGTAVLVVVVRDPSGRHRGLGVFETGEGLLANVFPVEGSRSAVRSTLDTLASRVGYRPVQVPVEWVRSRVAEARQRHAQAGVPEPLGLASARPLLEPVPGEPLAHPFDEEGLVLAEEDAAARRGLSARLHQLPELRSWMAPEAVVRELVGRVGATLAPEPPQEAVDAALRREILDATDRWFTPERRASLVRGMKDAGLGILARQGEDAALELSAVIQLVESAGLITDAPRELPFLVALVEKAVMYQAAQNDGKLSFRIPGRPEAGGDGPAADAGSPEPAAGDAEPPLNG
ncbi:MAG: hypothetical protein IT376_20505 [Polyangiaceae bacterium]|nr:hypothetical protein [Polyangiaceae bacterium]